MVRPLTKHTKSGELYVRPPAVEANIDGAMGDDAAQLRQRLAADRDAGDYLKSECLVHLIREFTRRGEDQIRNDLVMALLVRCDAILKSKIDPCRVRNADSLRETILNEFVLVLAGDGDDENPDELDCFECKFNLAFRAFRIDMMRGERKHDSLLSLPSDTIDTDDEVRSNPEVPSCRAVQQDGLIRADLLDRLPPDVRKAVILCHEMGYAAESDDPNKITAARLCNVSGRTIRKRLKQASEILSPFNEEEI